MGAAFSKQRRTAGWILSSPLLILLSALLVWPLYLGIKTSFTHDILSDFETYGNGLENYRNLFAEPNFWGSDP
jgi:ABC-type sugar transport system permease subunit